jgi:hypothetical protein
MTRAIEIERAINAFIETGPPRSTLERRIMLAAVANIWREIKKLPKSERARLDRKGRRT